MASARLFLHLHAEAKAVNHGFSRNPQWENYDEYLSSRHPAFNLFFIFLFFLVSLGSFYLCYLRSAFTKIIWSYFTQVFNCFPIGELSMLTSHITLPEEKFSFEFYRNRTEHFHKEIAITTKFTSLTLT